jgi:two-component system chemotaxis response regulator CheB
VMVSTLTEKDSDVTLRALELGAIDYTTKPKLDVVRGMHDYTDDITDKIRTAAKSRPRAMKSTTLNIAPSHTADAVLPPLANKISTTEKLIIIGASTGGTDALRRARHSGHPAHAGGFHQIVRRASGQPVQDSGEGGGKQ